jgi:hypothetical protein
VHVVLIKPSFKEVGTSLQPAGVFAAILRGRYQAYGLSYYTNRKVAAMKDKEKEKGEKSKEKEKEKGKESTPPKTPPKTPMRTPALTPARTPTTRSRTTSHDSLSLSGIGGEREMLREVVERELEATTEAHEMPPGLLSLTPARSMPFTARATATLPPRPPSPRTACLKSLREVGSRLPQYLDTAEKEEEDEYSIAAGYWRCAICGVASSVKDQVCGVCYMPRGVREEEKKREREGDGWAVGGMPSFGSLMETHPAITRCLTPTTERDSPRLRSH